MCSVRLCLRLWRVRVALPTARTCVQASCSTACPYLACLMPAGCRAGRKPGGLGGSGAPTLAPAARAAGAAGGHQGPVFSGKSEGQGGILSCCCMGGRNGLRVVLQAGWHLGLFFSGTKAWDVACCCMGDRECGRSCRARSARRPSQCPYLRAPALAGDVHVKPLACNSKRAYVCSPFALAGDGPG